MRRMVDRNRRRHAAHGGSGCRRESQRQAAGAPALAGRVPPRMHGSPAPRARQIAEGLIARDPWTSKRGINSGKQLSRQRAQPHADSLGASDADCALPTALAPTRRTSSPTSILDALNACAATAPWVCLGRLGHHGTPAELSPPLWRRDHFAAPRRSSAVADRHGARMDRGRPHDEPRAARARQAALQSENAE
jgi:hypothetical protein